MKFKGMFLMIVLCVSKVFGEPILTDTKHPKLWSILICTLEERKECFKKIYHKLKRQIYVNKLEDQIEILFFNDNREHSIGFKRNALLRESQGEYVCFVDDDDDVHDLYIRMIYEKLLQKPDCVSLVGIMTTHGKNPEKFIHSLRYNNKYCTERGVHLRPPNHLNPIKRSIAIQFLFPENNFGEDRSWTLALSSSGLLKMEAVIHEPYYFYQYDGKYQGQLIPYKKPRVSIITSVYKGDEFIEGFLRDIVRQTIFNECELIIINANSPGNEEPIIKQYADRYPNIIYERLSSDPGLYAVWNYGIKKARADLITNANIDDRRNPESLEMHAKILEDDYTIDLVYSEFYVTSTPHSTFENPHAQCVARVPEFSPAMIRVCLPGPMPMWRKAVHATCGWFREDFFSAADFEMWNRMVSHGITFKKVPGISGVYYLNPAGLSTDQDPLKVIRRNYEDTCIAQQYRYLWS